MSRATDLKSLIADAERVVVFTGAGISTESGIPDFRSPGGVWSKMKPITYQDFVANAQMRREAWNRVFSNSAGWTGATPNAGHRAVARLAETGKVTAVITQNVDNLHLDAGTPPGKVIELHGNGAYARCLDCGLRHEFTELKSSWEAGTEIVCKSCGGLLKSATISFGQSLPEREMRRAAEHAQNCDLFLVLGSSLVVRPANHFPLIAKRAGAGLVIVNREPTPLDDYADLVLSTDIGPLMAEAVT